MSIPIPHPDPFIGAIIHPTLYLWDAWSYEGADETHLYSLAVSRTDADGQVLHPSRRNERVFHVRHFLSSDGGDTWSDEGCFQEPRPGSNSYDSKTIWSGSIEPLSDGEKLVAYTGLRDSGAELQFQQSIGLATSSKGRRINQFYDEPLSCPRRDWQSITDLGYFLDDISTLGHRDGERGGPILAWRDPFVFVVQNEDIHLYWGAKVGSHKSALARALVERVATGFRLTKLFEPVVMPDSDDFTQLELPKVLHDESTGRYYLLISTCNRLYEGQTDAEVEKKVRLYSSTSLNGPWQSSAETGSIVLNDDSHMFGLTVLRADFENGELHCIAPYTEAAGVELGLTLSKKFTINLI